MLGFSVSKKIILFSFWRILSLFLFGGLKLNLLFFNINFIIGAKMLFYVWVLANACLVSLNSCFISKLSYLVHLMLKRYFVGHNISHFVFLKKYEKLQNKPFPSLKPFLSDLSLKLSCCLTQTSSSEM